TLYVPCDQMDTIAKYSGVDNKPRLNKLGGKEFEKIKQRVKNQIKKMAFDLKELYAQRESRKGYAFNKDSPLQKEFEDAFEFEETEDQLTSIAEIKKDMESPLIMDRLLCGDVGYGKTEVALRAAFKAIVDGKQAALLAPTTILSQQHYNLCRKRLGQYGVRLDVLNRFKSRKEQKEILDKIRQKQLDLIIGTHRLLSGDVKFNDLGLLIVDEEQRFGVEHKERVKNINKSVDVLSLSATPIPRTLHMSLSGIRDISIIDTPPSERLPVQTYVLEYSEGIVYDAVSRELARGGQVFILYNRTESIESFALKISQIVPYAKIITAHGQMREDALENAVEAFYKGNADVLICTTIIENGIDIANVNTLIVYEADRLGLSQLYQLRGRVGRGNRLAHVYFTYMPQKVLTENAYKRLKAIMEYTEFGSGFKIAIRDLEIRGAGSVLGARQHGHIENVGYDMYLKLLRQSMSDDNLQEEQIDFDIAADAYIPEKYIEENAHRMKVYQRIAMTDFEEKDEFIRELADIYGEVPQAVINLINIRLLKLAAKGSNVQSVTVKVGKAEITLGGIEKLQDNRILDAVEKYSDICSLKFTDKAQIVFNIKKADFQKTLEILIDFFIKTKTVGKN
ncbi:MAG: transcription-repair coupling factor, partial [Clostridia bacterium]|nr:transcription-repair coupling factor [Clostridia bacterium]